MTLNGYGRSSSIPFRLRNPLGYGLLIDADPHDSNARKHSWGTSAPFRGTCPPVLGTAVPLWSLRFQIPSRVVALAGPGPNPGAPGCMRESFCVCAYVCACFFALMEKIDCCSTLLHHWSTSIVASCNGTSFYVTSVLWSTSIVTSCNGTMRVHHCASVGN